jgi:hypothetical protein
MLFSKTIPRQRFFSPAREKNEGETKYLLNRKTLYLPEVRNRYVSRAEIAKLSNELRAGFYWLLHLQATNHHKSAPTCLPGIAHLGQAGSIVRYFPNSTVL